MVMRIGVLFVVWLLLFTVAQAAGDASDGQPKKIDGPALELRKGWSRYTFQTSDKVFSAAFPGKPRMQSRTAPGAGDRRIPVVSHELNADGGITYAVVYTDFPQGSIRKDQVDALFDQQIERSRARGATVVSQQPILINGNPGRDFEVEITTKTGTMRTLVRAVVVGDRSYQVMCVGPKSLDRAQAQYFIDSFRPAAP